MSDSQDYSDSQSREDSQQKKKLLLLEQRRIKQQLKEIPFGELISHQQSQKKLENAGKNKNRAPKKSKYQKKNEQQNVDKNAPKQIKIMKMPHRKIVKQIFQQKKARGIDPRFQGYAGSYNADLATKTYSFIRQMQDRQVGELKKQIHSGRIKQQRREVLMRNYNKITNEIKKNELDGIQQKIRQEYRKGNYIPKKREMRQEVQRRKLDNMDEKKQGRHINEKQKRIQKQRMIEKKQWRERTN